MFKQDDIVELVRNCTAGSPTGKGSIGRIKGGYIGEGDSRYYTVEFPSEEDFWNIKEVDMRKVKTLFPKQFTGFKYNYS